MNGYIKREELIGEFHRLKLGENSLIERLFADGVYAVIETFPTADVQEVKHAHWEYPYNGDIARCSNCEFSVQDKINNVGFMYNFCPNCGAKMDGKENEK